MEDATDPGATGVIKSRW